MGAWGLASVAHRSLNAIVPIKEAEVPSVLYSFFSLFSLLASYFLLLPLREDAGISLGTSNLPALFVCSLLVTLVFTPAASAFLSRRHPHRRELALKQFYSFMAFVLLAFYFMYNFSSVEVLLDRVHLTQQQQQQYQQIKQLVAQQRPGRVQHAVQQQWQQQQQQLEGPSRHMLSYLPAVSAAPGTVNIGVAAAYMLQQQQQQHSPRDPVAAFAQDGTSSFGSMEAALNPETGGSSGLDQMSMGSSSDSIALVAESKIRTAGITTTAEQQMSQRESSKGWSGGEVQATSRGDTAHAAAAAAAAAVSNSRRLQQLHDSYSSASSRDGVAAAEKQGAAPKTVASSDSSSNEAGSSSSSSGETTASSATTSSSSSSRRRVNSRTGDAALSRSQRLLRAAFYVWVNVMNLVGISSLWARCADTFAPEAGARLFGFISAGATLGQLTGSVMAMLVAWAAEVVVAAQAAAAAAGTAGVAGFGSGSDSDSSSSSSRHGSASGTEPPASGLILISALLQLLAAQLVCRVRPLQSTASVSVTATAGAGQAGGLARSHSLKRRSSMAERGAVGRLAIPTRTTSGGGGGGGGGGSFTCGGGSSSGTGLLSQRAGLHLHNVLSGFRLILSSRYLLLLCGNLLMTYVVGSLMYFQRALVVSTAVSGPSHRTAFFAALNTWSAGCILLMQLFATSSLLRVLGMPAALGLGPAVCLAGIIAISAWPCPAMVALFEIVRKVFGYAVNRPAREVLFTVVSRDEKYSAKLVIDTVVQRLGDAIAAAAFQVLDVQWSLGQAGVGAAGCVMCLVWLAAAHKLGQQHKQLAGAEAPAKDKFML